MTKSVFGASRSTKSNAMFNEAKKLLRERKRQHGPLRWGDFQAMAAELRQVSAKTLSRWYNHKYTLARRNCNLAKRRRPQKLSEGQELILLGFIGHRLESAQPCNLLIIQNKLRLWFDITFQNYDLTRFKKAHRLSLRSAREDRPLPHRDDLARQAKKWLFDFRSETLAQLQPRRVVAIDFTYIKRYAKYASTIAPRNR